MKFKHISMIEIERVIKHANIYFQDNIDFKNTEIGRTFNKATFRVKDSHSIGALLGYTPTTLGNLRHTISLCWHGHGHIFDWALLLYPDCIIETRHIKIYMEDGNIQGNWEDVKLGSVFEPVMYSDRCECEQMPPNPFLIEDIRGRAGKVIIT